MQGSPGTGKTTWLASLLRQVLSAEEPFGIVDCKADLFAEAVRSTAAIARRLPGDRGAALGNRLIVINPFAERLAPLNVCAPLAGIGAEAQAYEITLALSRLFENALSAHMETVLRHLVLLLAEARLTLVEAPLLLQDDVARGVLANQSRRSTVQEFFLRGWQAIPQVSKDALLVRLQGLLLSESCRLMLGADAVVDFRQVLDRGDPLLVFLGRGPGVPEEQVQTLGSLVFQLLLQAVYARGSVNPRRYALAIDEFSHLLTAPAPAQRFATALTTVRSFGLSLLLCHHSFSQLTQALRESMLANCDVVALFRTSARNAAPLGDFLPELEPGDPLVGPEEPRLSRRDRLERVQHLPARTFYWYDRRRPHPAVRLRSPDVPPAHQLAGMTPDEFERYVRDDRWDQGSVALSRVDLEAQVEARRARLRELSRPPRPPRPPQHPGESGMPRLG